MKRLLLVRHGESEWNAERRLQGQADISLSAKGEAQALALASTIEDLAPDRVVASDLRRARHTAQLLGHSDPELDAGLREINVGDWTGMAIADIVAQDPEGYRGWRAGTFAPPGGEVWKDFADRTTEAAMRSFETADRLLVVCHGGVIRALIQTLLGLPPQRIIPVGPASITILANRPGESEMRLEVFNAGPGRLVVDSPD